MGATVSVVGSDDDGVRPTEVVLKRLPDAIEESLYVHERFPLIIDTSEQAARFLKYQTGSFINQNDPIQFTKKNLNRALVGAMQYGRTMTLKFDSLRSIDPVELFEVGLFPSEILNRSEFYKEEIWQSIIKPDLGDPEPGEVSISTEFVFIICTRDDYIPPALERVMHVIKVVENSTKETGQENSEGNGDNMEQILSLYGAKEIIR